MLKVLSVFGTRPEAIKMAPVIKELKRVSDKIKLKVVITAQHREMLDQVLNLFQIQPDYDLGIMRSNQDIFDITRRVLTGLRSVLEKEKPDLVLVHGDTTTTFTAALAAFYLQISVGHVEAGLRTAQKYSPFPEEMNRHLTGVLADFHFAPTAIAERNLLQERVAAERIFVTGNTVIDALQATVQPDYHFIEPVLSKINYNKRRVLLVTTHRRENLGEPMRAIYLALREIVENYPNVEVVFPVHLNPAVRSMVQEVLSGLDRVHLIEPLDYQPFVNLMQRCYLVITDSGGLQEEAPSLGKPVLVLREVTERPEALESGTVLLVGNSKERVAAEIRKLLDDPVAYRCMAEAVNPYGDGQAANRIVAAILYQFGLSNVLPERFYPRKKFTNNKSLLEK